MEENGYITQDDFLKMLMNYPMEHINNITDGLKEDLDQMKNMKGESMAKLSASLRDEPNEELDNRVNRGRQRRMSQNSAEDYYTDARKGDIGLSKGIKARRESVNSKNIQLSNESKDNLSDRNIKGKKSASKGGSAVPSQYEGMSMVMRRKNSADSVTNYQIQCTTINNRIKQYVAGLFLELDCHTTGQMTKDKFRLWISQHPMVLTHFEQNFQVTIWSVLDKERDTLSFKKLTPDVNFYANFSSVTKKKERLWIEVHKRFLICLQSKDDNVPRRVVLLDGLTMTLPESNDNMCRIVLSSKSPYYKTVNLELEDREAYQQLITKYAYLRE